MAATRFDDDDEKLSQISTPPPASSAATTPPPPSSLNASSRVRKNNDRTTADVSPPPNDDDSDANNFKDTIWRPDNYSARKLTIPDRPEASASGSANKTFTSPSKQPPPVITIDDDDEDEIPKESDILINVQPPTSPAVPLKPDPSSATPAPRPRTRSLAIPNTGRRRQLVNDLNVELSTPQTNGHMPSPERIPSPAVPEEQETLTVKISAEDHDLVLDDLPSPGAHFAPSTGAPERPLSPSLGLKPFLHHTKPDSSASISLSQTGLSKKSKAARRSASPPSPIPAPPRPPMRTIRLEIKLGGPENYSVDVSRLAKETGQRSPTPEPIKRDVSDSEGEGEGDGEAELSASKSKGKGKSGKKKSLATEYYDLNDPFIDDSELAVDERTYFGQTKQQGFYVCSGDVALLKDKTVTPKKPKSTKRIVPTIIPLAGSAAVNAGSASTPTHKSSDAVKTDATPLPLSFPTKEEEGTRETPIALLSDGEDSKTSVTNVLKRKASADEPASANGAGKKKRKKIEIEMFHPDLQAALYRLKDAIAQESFETKNKFPPNLKPVLKDTALVAIHCGEYNDNFFSLMPKMFIYNKFTMTKLIKRTVYQDHQQLLLARQDELLSELAHLSDEGFAKAQEDYTKSFQQWERRQEGKKHDLLPGGPSTEGTPVPGSATPSVHGGALPSGDTSMDVEGPSGTQNPSAGGDDDDGGHGRGGPNSANPPSKRYRLSERMRNIIWELVVLSNESCRIENEKNQLENSTVQVSEQGTRKVLYQKIVAAFPDGWMSSGQISREVSVMKKRYEAQQQEGVAET